MKILFNVHHSNENAYGCEYAVVDLPPQLAAEIVRRLDLFAQIHTADIDLAEMEYHDCSATFLSALPEDLEEKLPSDEDYLEAEISDEDIQRLAERTECDRLVVCWNEVWWSCYPKHCDWMAETRPLPADVIRRAAGVKEEVKA